MVKHLWRRVWAAHVCPSAQLKATGESTARSSPSTMNSSVAVTLRTSPRGLRPSPAPYSLSPSKRVSDGHDTYPDHREDRCVCP